MPSPRRSPKPDRRRALELLAASRDGCAEAIMLAHGFTVELMVDLCSVEVVRMKITEAGRQAINSRR